MRALFLILTLIFLSSFKRSTNILDGKAVVGDGFKNVVALVNNRKRIFCTGTLIHPKVIVSATHCLDEVTPQRSNWN